MGKPLFENVGKDLKSIANTIYLSTMIGYVLVSLGLFVGGCILLSSEGAIGWLGVLFSIGLVVSGHFKAKLAVIELYAYGELVDRVISIESIVSKKSKSDSSKSGGMGRKVTPVRAEYETPATKREADGSWTCLFCDHVNRPGTNCCEECNVVAKFE